MPPDCSSSIVLLLLLPNVAARALFLHSVPDSISDANYQSSLPLIRALILLVLLQLRVLQIWVAVDMSGQRMVSALPCMRGVFLKLVLVQEIH